MEGKPRLKNLVIILLIIVAFILTGVGAYFLRIRNNDTSSDASTSTAPIRVYFEPETAEKINGNIVEANLFFENTPGQQVTGGTVILKFPSNALSFNKARTTAAQTQANAACKQNQFKLEGILDATDNGDGTATITRFAPFSDPSFVPPSGKFCFGTISFTVTNQAVENIKIEFETNNPGWKIVGPKIVYEKSFGTVAGKGNFVTIGTVATTSTPVSTVAVTTSAKPSTTSSTTPTQTSQPVATASPTDEEEPGPDPDEEDPTTSEDPTATPTPGDLPDTAVPMDTAIVMMLGTMLVITGVYVFNNRYRV